MQNYGLIILIKRTNENIYVRWAKEIEVVMEKSKR